MIETLPRRYRITLWFVGVVACVGAGAWLAFATPLPMVWQLGAVLGALAAPLLVGAYLRTLGNSGKTAARGRAV